MFTEKEIDKLKKQIPSGITYQMIADACEGKVLLWAVKQFYSKREVPFETAVKIVKSTKKLIQKQILIKEKALSE